MANAAVAAWTACIKDLQKLVGGSCPVPTTAQVVERMTEMAGDPNTPLPNAAWKELVHEIQVLSCHDPLLPARMDLQIHAQVEHFLLLVEHCVLSCCPACNVPCYCH